MPTWENQQIICCVCSPLFPGINRCLFPVKIVQERDLFISPTHLISCCWRGTATSVQISYLTYPRMTSCRWLGTEFHVQVLSPIYPRCAEAVPRSSEEDEGSRANVGIEALASDPIPMSNETSTGTVTKTALSFEVNHLDAMTVSPPWVNVSLEGI